jgi:Flp pilus assembly protein TadG
VTLFTRGKRGKAKGLRERGQTIVEFSLVALAFFMLMFGILDGARMFQSWITVQHAARSGARYAITGRITCDQYPSGDNRVACTTWEAKKSTTGLAGGGASGADVTVSFQAFDFVSGGYDPPDTDTLGKACDAMEVTVTYRHHFSFPVMAAIAPSGLDLNGRQRMVNEPFGVCNANDGTS